MRGVFTLVRLSLRRYRTFLLSGYLLLIGFQFAIIWSAAGIERSGRFAQMKGLMPDFIAKWTNMAAMSFQGFVLFGYSHPVVLLFLVAVAISIGSEPAAEIELKFIDLVMARPVRRSAAIHRTLIVLTAALTGAVACMLLGTWLGLMLLAPESAQRPEPQVVLSLGLNLISVALAWGGITLVIAAFAKRRAVTTAIAGFLAFGCFVLDYIGRFWDTMRVPARISPFHYFNPFEMIGGLPLRGLDIVTLAGILAAGWIIALAAYNRRDL